MLKGLREGSYLKANQSTYNIWKQQSDAHRVLCNKMVGEYSIHFVVVMSYKVNFFVALLISLPGGWDGCSTAVSTLVRRQAAQSST